MPATTDDLLREQNGYLKELVKNSTGRSTPSITPSSIPSSTSPSGLLSSVTSTYLGLGRDKPMSTAQVTASMTAMVREQFPHLGISEATKIATQFVESLQYASDVMKDTGKVGYTASGHLGDMGDQTAKLSMTLSELYPFMTKWSQTLGKFGPGLDGSMKMMSEFGTKLYDSSVIKFMLEQGIAIEEINDILLTSATAYRAKELADDESKKRFIAFTTQLGVEVDQMAKITGKQREVQRQALEEELARGDTKAAMDAMDIQGKSNYQRMFASLETMLGKSAAKIASDVLRFDGITQYSAPVLASMKNPQELIALLQAAKRPGITAEESEEIIARFKNRLAEEAAYTLNPNSAASQLARYGSMLGEYGQAAMEKRVQSQALGSQIEQTQAEMSKQLQRQVSIEEARSAIVSKYEKQMAGITDAGEKDKEAIAARAIRSSDFFIREMSASTLTAITPFNNAIMDATTALKDFIKPLKGEITSKSESTVDEIKKGLTSIFSTDQMSMDKIQAWFKSKGLSFAGGTDDMGEFLSGYQYPTGKDFKDGTLAMLHGKESVVPHDKWPEIAEKFRGEDILKSHTELVSSTSSSQSTLNDIRASLMKLNDQMNQVVHNTGELIDTGHKQIRTIRRTSPNQLA